MKVSFDDVYKFYEYDVPTKNPLSTPITEFIATLYEKDINGNLIRFKINTFLYGEEWSVCENNQATFSLDTFQEDSLTFFRVEKIGNITSYPELFLCESFKYIQKNI